MPVDENKKYGEFDTTGELTVVSTNNNVTSFNLKVNRLDYRRYFQGKRKVVEQNMKNCSDDYLY